MINTPIELHQAHGYRKTLAEYPPQCEHWSRGGSKGGGFNGYNFQIVAPDDPKP